MSTSYHKRDLWLVVVDSTGSEEVAVERSSRIVDGIPLIVPGVNHKLSEILKKKGCDATNKMHLRTVEDAQTIFRFQKNNEGRG